MGQKFDLKNMGFAEMRNEELKVVDGGGFWNIVGEILGATVLGGVLATAGAIDAGYSAGASFADGWNSVK